KSNKTVGLAHRVLGTERATELAEVMGAVGLAQNLSALRSLGTEGIQKGHMTLHARSVASTAGTPEELFDKVLERLLESGEIKVWKAKEIIDELRREQQQVTAASIEREANGSESFGYGKIILTGEHSVVFGKHAVAAPIALKMKAKVWERPEDVCLIIPQWGVEHILQFEGDHRYSVYRSLEMILKELDLRGKAMTIKVTPEFPKAMGMGGSAALAVAIIRALNQHYELGLTEEDIRELSYKSETIIHGTASGIDNTVSTYGQLISYRKDEPPEIERLSLSRDIPIVIGISGIESMTSKMVRRVREARNRQPEWYDTLLDPMNELSLKAREAIEELDLAKLGLIMNLNHGYLNTLSVSSPEVEELVETARAAGALGAKLTGGGGGGAMVALCDSAEMQQQVQERMQQAGYDGLITEIKASI
ncbi:MAG TPA: mevalonate kinase, partial [Fodinibius sp.]|nr:mevalonate kinase [Fodinibius sp.]